MRTWHALGITVALLAACQPVAEKQDSGARYVRGTARVISVDSALGRVVLDYQHQQVEAYWQTEVLYAQGGSVVAPDSPFKTPVGLYMESSIKGQEFPGKPGDTVAFMGLRTGRSIFLQAVSVVSH